MTELAWHDLQYALLRAPKNLLAVLKEPEWAGHVFVAGGFIRATVAGEFINDIDLFTRDKEMAQKLARDLVRRQECSKFETLTDEGADKKIHETDNAFTLRCYKPAIQIIHRWTFPPHAGSAFAGTSEDGATAVAASFDFTVCCAVIWWGVDETEGGHPLDDKTIWKWRSYCDPRFYSDLAAKRLIYRRPVRVEDAGGSMLRVLKYYQREYRIPIDSLGAIIARVACAVEKGAYDRGEEQVAKVITGLLREVDPNVDPNHVAHLPAEGVAEQS